MKSLYFYCYSFALKNFIKKFGIKYITKAINPKTRTPYFMYEKSSKLDEIIRMWNELKNNSD